ncbi:hypothetical protein [Mesorhizobium sp. M0809]|uniref:hypothetical protein n=1 Tax=Mesorhizobium sp. M0809 TaxID=2957003 RepID=UPI003334EB7F
MAGSALCQAVGSTFSLIRLVMRSISLLEPRGEASFEASSNLQARDRPNDFAAHPFRTVSESRPSGTPPITTIAMISQARSTRQDRGQGLLNGDDGRDEVEDKSEMRVSSPKGDHSQFNPHLPEIRSG